MRWEWLAFDDLGVDRLYAVIRLREEVFVVEQDCVYLDADGRDPEALHLLGWDDDGLAAYLRAFAPGVVHPQATLGRVVVAPRRRGEGLGVALMTEGLREVAACWGRCPVHVSAQAHLARFYRSLGFEVVGPGYLEDGIPHLPMTATSPRPE